MNQRNPAIASLIILGLRQVLILSAYSQEKLINKRSDNTHSDAIRKRKRNES